MGVRRVVITGYGSVTPLGLGVDAMWSNLLAGQHGFKPLDDLRARYPDLRAKVYGPVSGYDALDHFSSKELRKYDPFIQYGVVASREAFAHAGLNAESLDFSRAGVAIGSGIGGLKSIEENHVLALEGGAKRISPFFIPAAIVNMVAGVVSIDLGLRGPNYSIVSACATGTHNIGLAYRNILFGEADVMLAGGSEAGSVILGVGGFAALRGLSSCEDPSKASRPWDRDRDGFVLSDGSGVVVLEDYDHAVSRGANILAEVVGFGMSADAYHITKPGGSGAVDAMTAACRDASLEPKEIDYVNAHATSTPVGDANEAKAMAAFFGDALPDIKVGASKSMLGHMLGATGSVEAIICAKSLLEQTVAPSINCPNPDEGLGFDYVRDTPRPCALTYTLNNSFGFGGTNASLIFKRFEA
jgi:3-oxoacyl-[acyl-carrier-protein] synthase II